MSTAKGWKASRNIKLMNENLDLSQPVGSDAGKPSGGIPPCKAQQCSLPSPGEQSGKSSQGPNPLSSTDVEPRSDMPSLRNGLSASEEQGQGVVIQFDSSDEALAWCTDEDGDTSLTSTPDFKRGKHHTAGKECNSALTLQAVGELKQEAEVFALGGGNIRPLSMQLLADTCVKHWPMVDHVVGVEYKPGWSIKQWTAALRVELIRITCGTIVVYLDKTRSFQQVLPLKNNLLALCKVIRQHQRNS